MTSVDHVTALLPGSAGFAELLAQIASGAKDRDLNDENPFDQVTVLKRAGFGMLRLPECFGGPGLPVPQLSSAVIDVARADSLWRTSSQIEESFLAGEADGFMVSAAQTPCIFDDFVDAPHRLQSMS